MADITIFRGSQPVLIGVPVDLRFGETHAKDATITRQPIEDGSLSSDHIILQPESVEITALVSNFDGDNLPAVGSRARTAWQELARLRKLRVLFDVLTSHELYSDMALASLNGANRAPINGELFLTARFEKVDRVRSSLTDIQEGGLASTGEAPVSKTASSEVNAGRRDPVQPEDDRSLAAQISDKLSGEAQ